MATFKSVLKISRTVMPELGVKEGQLNQSLRKSCVIIVTYNRIPNIGQLNKALSAGTLDGIIIVDNSGKPSLINGIKSQYLSEHLTKYYLIENNENLGISKALNKGFRKAMEEGFYFIYLLDDDATISENFFEIERETFERLAGEGKNVGAICPVVSNNPDQLDDITKKYTISEVRYAITSGLLITTDTINKVGGYDERFFLEWADIVLTQAITSNGLRIFRINQILVVQDFLSVTHIQRLPSLNIRVVLSVVYNGM